jgi:hypothetical protein
MAVVSGIEPSAANGRPVYELGIANFVGAIASHGAQTGTLATSFDIATITWTLENCHTERFYKGK